MNSIEVSRNFGGDVEVAFPGCVPAQAVNGADVLALVTDAVGELEAIPALAKETALKADMLRRLQNVVDQTRSNASLSVKELAALREQMFVALPDQAAATSSLVPRLRRLIEAVHDIEGTLRIEPPHKNKDVCHLIAEYLPNFVYYSNYGNLDSEIYLPHVVQNLKRDDLGTKEAGKARTLRVLFRFVRLKCLSGNTLSV